MTSAATVLPIEDSFAAAVDLCGVSNLANFMRAPAESTRSQLGDNWYACVGDSGGPEGEGDMPARSPITRVDQIRMPLVVIQGSCNVRVVQEKSDRTISAVSLRGVKVECLVKSGEGHHFQNTENPIDGLRAMEGILARHL